MILSPFKDDLFVSKTIIILGASTGFGKTTAKMLFEQGARVYMLSRSMEKLIKAKNDILSEVKNRVPDNLIIDVCDIGDPVQIKEVYKKIFQENDCDYLINNAATNFMCPSEKLGDNVFELSMKTNYQGYFVSCREFVKNKIKKSTRGKIINISAYAGTKAFPGVTHLLMAKKAVLAMTSSLAQEWGRFGITLNALCPGPVLTESVVHAYGRILRINAESKSEYKNKINDHITKLTNEMPLGKIILEEEIAFGIVFLLSQAANNITGSELVIDGGYYATNPEIKNLMTE